MAGAGGWGAGWHRPSTCGPRRAQQRPSTLELGRKLQRGLSSSKLQGLYGVVMRKRSISVVMGTPKASSKQLQKHAEALHSEAAPPGLGWKLQALGASAAWPAVPTASSHPHSGFGGRRKRLSFQGWSLIPKPIAPSPMLLLPQSCSLCPIRQTQKLPQECISPPWDN